MLRVEVATKYQARLISWSVYTVNTIIALLAVGLVFMRVRGGFTVGQVGAEPLGACQPARLPTCLAGLDAFPLVHHWRTYNGTDMYDATAGTC